eukprot:GFUD01025549.1.p1 GENE.GFUD01025549.1~~GFUD01025549.1.p1  ORF type:complete len:150 (+),score=34.57 GFUD01025549.1:45-494(+)
MADARGGCVMVFKILTSSMGIIMGCVAFPVFTFLFVNVHAGLWALLSIIQASMVLHLHLLYKSYRLETWHTPHSLSACRDLGLLTMVGGLAGTVYYIYTAVVNQEPMFPISDSSKIAAVWAFMCVKWGAGLAFFGQKYKLVIDREYSLL